jgi:hypothetical protein
VLRENWSGIVAKSVELTIVVGAILYSNLIAILEADIKGRKYLSFIRV